MASTLSAARTRHAVGQAGTYVVVIAIVLAVLIPLFWMVSASLKTQNEVYSFAWLPRVPQYMGIPRELDDSAKMDGCTFFQIYWHLLLPLSRPALTTVGIYIFLANWEDLIRPVLFINSEQMRTVSVGLALLSEATEQAPEHHLMMAVSVIFIIAPVVIFLLFQRYFRQMGEGGLDTVSIK